MIFCAKMLKMYVSNSEKPRFQTVFIKDAITHFPGQVVANLPLFFCSQNCLGQLNLIIGDCLQISLLILNEFKPIN